MKAVERQGMKRPIKRNVTITGCITKYFVKGTSRPKWRYRLSRGEDQTSGTRTRPGKGNFTTERECIEAKDAHIAQLRKELDGLGPVARVQDKEENENMPLCDWVNRRIDNYASATCELKTIERYQQLIRYLTENPDEKVRTVASTPLKSVQWMHDELEGALLKLYRQPAKRRAHLSAATIHDIAQLLNVSFNKAIKKGLVHANPVAKFENLPKVVKKEAVSFNADQLGAIQEASAGDWTNLFIELLGACGGRRGEIIALRWSDINWDTAEVSITRSRAQIKGLCYCKPPKGDRNRKVKLDPDTLAALKRWRDEQADYIRQFGRGYNTDEDLVFARSQRELPDTGPRFADHQTAHSKGRGQGWVDALAQAHPCHAVA
jgi:integrase